MALGNKAGRPGGSHKHGKAILDRLNRHFELMTKLMAETGLSKEEASTEAFRRLFDTTKG